MHRISLSYGSQPSSERGNDKKNKTPCIAQHYIKQFIVDFNVAYCRQIVYSTLLDCVLSVLDSVLSVHAGAADAVPRAVSLVCQVGVIDHSTNSIKECIHSMQSMPSVIHNIQNVLIIII